MALGLTVATSSIEPGRVEQARYEVAVDLSDRPGFAGVALAVLERYDRAYPDGRFGADVQLRAARMERDLGRPHRAAARLLGVRVLHPATRTDEMAAEDLSRLFEKNRSLRRLRPRFEQALERFRSPDAPMATRREAFVRSLLLVDDDEVWELVRAESQELLDTRAGDPEIGDIAFSLGDLLRRHGQAREAVAVYGAIARLHVEQGLVARARLREGDVLARDLDQAVVARDVYAALARDQESAPEAASAWLRLGDLERRKLKRPEIAVRDYDELLNRYPDHPDAFDALMAKAEVLHSDLGEAEQAVATLEKGVARYERHARAPEALEWAARVAEKTLRDRARAAQLYESVAVRYASYANAVACLMRAAELVEEGGDLPRAASLYEQLTRQFPGTKEASRAARRRERIGP